MPVTCTCELKWVVGAPPVRIHNDYCPIHGHRVSNAPDEFTLRDAEVAALRSEQETLRRISQAAVERADKLQAKLDTIEQRATYENLLFDQLSHFALMADWYDAPMREGGSVPRDEQVIVHAVAHKLTIGDLRRARDTIKGIEAARTLANDPAAVPGSALKGLGGLDTATGDALDRIADSFGVSRRPGSGQYAREETDAELRARLVNLLGMPGAPMTSREQAVKAMGAQAKQTLDDQLRSFMAGQSSKPSAADPKDVSR